jgi:hypothetical protein
LLAYACWPEEGGEERAIAEPAELLDDIARQLQRTMWRAARRARDGDGSLYRSEADELRSIVRRLTGGRPIRFRWQCPTRSTADARRHPLTVWAAFSTRRAHIRVVDGPLS